MEAVDDDGQFTLRRAATAIHARIPCQNLFEWHCYDGGTWRDALDAAMAAPPCVGELGECSQSHTIRLNSEDPQPPLKETLRTAGDARDSRRLDVLEELFKGGRLFAHFSSGEYQPLVRVYTKQGDMTPISWHPSFREAADAAIARREKMEISSG
jgi:hypothetical protein